MSITSCIRRSPTMAMNSTPTNMAGVYRAAGVSVDSSMHASAARARQAMMNQALAWDSTVADPRVTAANTAWYAMDTRMQATAPTR